MNNITQSTVMLTGRYMNAIERLAEQSDMPTYGNPNRSFKLNTFLQKLGKYQIYSAPDVWSVSSVALPCMLFLKHPNKRAYMYTMGNGGHDSDSPEDFFNHLDSMENLIGQDKTMLNDLAVGYHTAIAFQEGRSIEVVNPSYVKSSDDIKLVNPSNLKMHAVPYAKKDYTLKNTTHIVVLDDVNSKLKPNKKHQELFK